MRNDAKFDVFLCHNSEDKDAVIEIAEQLEAGGLRPWLDEWELRPGLSWQLALEQQIEQIASAAVFVGASGLGPWQQQEIYAFLNEFVSRKCPVIPVILANAPQRPDLPIFLKNNTWVDFRRQRPDPFDRLLWGVTGKKPTRIHTHISPKHQLDRSTQSLLANLDSLNSLGLGRPFVPKTSECVKLISSVGMDYSILRDLLAEGKWKEADRETVRVFLAAANPTTPESPYLAQDSIGNFPCQDLEIINRLWVEYSNEKFGFSIQKRIWDKIVGKGTSGIGIGPLFADDFFNRIQWKKGKSWLPYSNLIFKKNAPVGHLPTLERQMDPNGLQFIWEVMGRSNEWAWLFQRLETCKIT
ncbi:MAG: GUN4 domain-containing protein [Synechococcus sp.]